MAVDVRVLVGAILLALSGPAGAEPSDTIRWLMNEPANMLDLGMYRLRQQNSEVWAPRFAGEDRVAGSAFERSTAVYDWERNRIAVSVTVFGTPTEKECRELLKVYKDAISPRRHQSEFARLLVTHFFSHINFSAANRPEKLDKKLLNIMEFSVGIYEKQEGKTGNNRFNAPVIFCSNGLLETSPRYGKFNFPG